MTKDLQYLKYLIRHKWHVLVECCKCGLPWAGIVHDLSKFLPSEWVPYRNYFYDRPPLPSTGYIHKTGVDERFDRAWLKHIHRNPHHWQWYILHEDDGPVKVLEMPLRYRMEMLCDWKGAGKAQGKPDTAAWYRENRKNMVLGPRTRLWVEHHLGVLFDGIYQDFVAGRISCDVAIEMCEERWKDAGEAG